MTRKHSNKGIISNVEFGVKFPIVRTASQTKDTETEGEFIVKALATVHWLFKEDSSVDFTVTITRKCWFAVGFGYGVFI